MSRAAIQAVAGHEMGHVAGLAGVSTSCVLMNDWQDLWADCGVNIPVDDDIQGINALY
jgi:hypothetical protein